MRKIHLNSKKYPGHFALVDDVDFERVSQYQWSIQTYAGKSLAYAVREEKRKRVYLHRAILCTEKMVDHKNGNGLDCRRMNLRECTRSENACNQKMRRQGNNSGFKGVHFQNGRFFARLQVNGVNVFSKSFPTVAEAHAAYCAAAKKYHGKFANFG